MTTQQIQWFDALTVRRQKWVDANLANGFENGLKNLLTRSLPRQRVFHLRIIKNGDTIMILDTDQLPLKAIVVDPTHLILSRPITAGTGQVDEPDYRAAYQSEAEERL